MELELDEDDVEELDDVVELLDDVVEPLACPDDVDALDDVDAPPAPPPPMPPAPPAPPVSTENVDVTLPLSAQAAAATHPRTAKIQGRRITRVYATRRAGRAQTGAPSPTWERRFGRGDHAYWAAPRAPWEDDGENTVLPIRHHVLRVGPAARVNERVSRSPMSKNRIAPEYLCSAARPA